MEFSLEGLNKITDWLQKFERFLSIVLALIWFGLNAYLKVFKEIWVFIAQKVNTMDPGSIGQVNFGIVDGIAYVNAVFPVSEMIGLYTIYFFAWINLILIRWAKSFIPTVAN